MPQDADIDEEMLNGNYPHSSEIMRQNRGQGCIKDIPNKQIFDPTTQRNGNNTPQPVQPTSDIPVDIVNGGSSQTDLQSFELPNISHLLENFTSSQHLSNRSDTSTPEITSSYSSQLSARGMQSSQSNPLFIPNLAMLNINESNDVDTRHATKQQLHSEHIPNISMLNAAGTEYSSAQQESSESEYLPQLSAFNVADVQNSSQHSGYMPALSILNLSDTHNSTGCAETVPLKEN